MVLLLASLLPKIVDLAQKVAKEILKLYQSQQTTFLSFKENATPLTSADIFAHQCISESLKTITPNLPIISEEMDVPDFNLRRQWQQYWLIDPLDGTKGFLDRSGDFCINIALIIDHAPVLGVIAIPVHEVCYAAILNGGAWKYKKDGDSLSIYTRQAIPPLQMLTSNYHQSSSIEILFKKIAIKESIKMSSAYKICLIAEGKADLYPRFGPTMEWDTAAAHCILREAGGNIFTLQGIPLSYNTKENLHNFNFIAVGDCAFAQDNIFSINLFP